MTTATTEPTQKSSSVPVSGGSLYYEALGRGPTLVMIPTGHGTGVVFEPLAASLASHFRVLVYDRRYFFRSCKCDPVGSAQNQSILKAHAEDAAALIAHVSPDSPVYLFTTSSGALIAAELLYSRPHVIRRLVMHDARGVVFLADFYAHADAVAERFGRYMVEKAAAWGDQLEFADYALTGLASLPREMKFKWLANEFPKILEYGFQMDKMRPFRDRLLLMRGSVNTPDAAVGPVTRLSDALELPLGVVPGGHEGYVTNYRVFTEFLVEELREQ